MGYSGHSLILKNDGTVWGCGYNYEGEVGLGDSNDRNIFTQVTANANNVKSVYCSTYNTFILKNDGTLWGCGYNSCGQLGLGNTTDRKTFTQITTNTDNVKSVYCGCDHTFVLKNDGTLWGCGQNYYGELGLGDTSNRYTFTQVTTNTDDIKEVYCGYNHTLILKNDGTLWGTGYNNNKQLGLSDYNITTFTQITTNADDIKSVCCGSAHTFILKNDGTLWSCGLNNYGQLGLGNTTDRNTFTQITTNRTTFTQITTNADDIKSVFCGNDHTFILKNDGTLWSCGRNDYGQLGLGDGANRYTFTQVTTNINNIKEVYCGNCYTIILKNDGTLLGCGKNGNGELGLGDNSNRYTFIQATTNTNNIKSLPNQYGDIPSIIKVYDLNTGLIETLDTNNFKNIPVDKFEKIKVLYTNPDETLINCLISFDNKSTWKTFDGINWATVSDTTPNNILLSGMSLKAINSLDKTKLIQGGFTGNMDFKIALKTNNKTKTPSITKIYIQYKN